MIHLEHRYADALPELTAPASPPPAPDAEMLVLNVELALELGLDVDFLLSGPGVQFLLGHDLPGSAQPVAMRYSGHQFGGFSPQLGDGRAMLLGEIPTADGLRDLHLKGSGPTELSRGGDGFAAVGPMLREYVVSEAMHALGIPTTRSLAVIATGNPVYREDGAHPGAVLVRVAASHLRVGTFQFARATERTELLNRLVSHAVVRHVGDPAQLENPALSLFAHVVEAQATLVAQWLSVGFVHGVMNTDNVTISGETIDYGPCAFLDAYSPGAVFSSIDTGGRYAYGNQAGIAQWNLTRFAEALLPAVSDDESEAVELLTPVLNEYPRHFNNAWLAAMGSKIGLDAASVDRDTLIGLVTDLHVYLEASAVDFTTFFRDLAAGSEPSDLAEWITKWKALSPDLNAMSQVNPIHIPRNHLLDAALSAAESGDLTLVEELIAAVRAPFIPLPGGEHFAQPAPAEFAAEFRTYCGT